ncbi:hypothetical protein F7725_014652 [Dissostichus mawsoni]|uniref:CWH43-like N-terminal domain-containing protein n=1 Tax=Dissostichus mawsoni TaxID=36200 RepID=A0A7J5YWI5_DISMA|nr:hypothetical protein F7725_014652 [Dissostichus mawsoni]
MSLWMILPVSLPVFTITGIWVVYAMSLYNQHVCPVHNWLYNESCEEQLPLQRGPVLCCTLDNIPLISKCGTLPPESCFFSLICSTGSFMVFVLKALPLLFDVVLQRNWVWWMNVVWGAADHRCSVSEKHQNCILAHTAAALAPGSCCRLIMVGNFQVDFAKVLHYVGAGVTFPSSMLFVCLQSALTYRLAKTQEEYRIGHLRVGMALLALVALVLSGVFFCQESFALQHASAIFEWIYCMLIMLFYGLLPLSSGTCRGTH